jgi:hypothetical protein
MTVTFAATPSWATVGKKMAIVVATGADASFVNSKAFPIVAKTATTVTVELGVSGKVVTGTASTLAVFDGDSTIQVDYTSSQHTVVDSLTTAASEKYMRFEGLNTANSNKSVVVEVFRFLTDPLKELALISDTVQQFTIEGTVLLDATQLTGSKYFRQMIS